MQARLTRYSVPGDRVDDFIRAFDERSADSDAMPSEALLLVDRAAGAAVSISLWESQEAMTRGGGEAGAKSRQKAIDAASASVSGTETFEVAMQLREREPVVR